MFFCLNLAGSDPLDVIFLTNSKSASNLPILQTATLRGAVRHRTSLTSVVLQTLRDYDLMNQNTTIGARETKMDHVSVISIKKRVHLSPTCQFRGQPL